MMLQLMFVLSSLLPGYLAVTRNHIFPANSTIASVLWRHHLGFWVETGNSSSAHKVGTAKYSNEVNSTGWTFLDLETLPQFPDKIQAFAAGYLEGWVTSSLLHMHYQNTIVGRCDGKQGLCDKIDSWVQTNDRWVKRKVRHHKHSNPYWHHVGLTYQQINGLYSGYKGAVKHQPEMDVITYKDILTMNIFGDLEDLESAMGTSEVPAIVRGAGHCSALVRLLPNNSDLYVSHDTWNSYQNMLRIVKKYRIPYRVVKDQEIVPGLEMTFSGYPGVIYSGDDFTIISSGLTALETTIGNSNPALWKYLSPHGSVLEGIRATVSNRLATSGKTWTEMFALHNSGTYNNQWMVVDNKLFTPGSETLSHGLFWVLEQLPGYTEAADLTQVLEKKTFWPSYNSPYFPEVFNKSGNYDLMLKLGDWFSYDRTPRAKIFARDAPNVTDMESMIKLMRYNNYREDPFSACNCTPPYSAENAISARCDLNPRNGTYPFGALGHRSHGGTDMKVTSSLMAAKLEFIAQSGPTWDPLPPFRWSEQDFHDTPHVGHPDLWQFPPIHHQWLERIDAE